MIYSRLTKTLLTLASAAVMSIGVATSASAATGTNTSSGANLTARPAAGVALDTSHGKYALGNNPKANEVQIEVRWNSK